MTQIRVLIADDMALHRELLTKLLERQPDIVVIGEAGSPDEAVSTTGELSPDVVLVDLRMPRHDPQGGIRAIRQIVGKHPQVKVLALTESDDETDVRAAALAGAIGYIVKSVKAAKIAEAVRAAHAGKGWLDPSVTAYLLHDYRRASQESPSRPALTQTELRVLQLVAAGQTTIEIADELFIAEKTVKNHLASIYRKLGVKNRSHAVSEGYRQGLLN
ncbi:MAG: response regulator transcription factor [Anaerolineales bacterium]|nr:MAG: response regulator transcription factor [Anaerolineales bacterium]